MHSPLLKESLWVSHPPPTYMLKFSGLADLSSCFGKQTGKSLVHTSCHAATQLQRSYTQAQRPACSKQGTYIVCVMGHNMLWHTMTHHSIISKCSCCILQMCVRTQTLKQANLQKKPKGTMHIQVSIDSRNSAIQHVYHTLLHPSSSSQPRHPMLKIV